MLLIIGFEEKLSGRLIACGIMLKAAYKILVLGRFYGRVSYDTDEDLYHMGRAARAMTTTKSDVKTP
ncbi:MULTISPECIES: hypothetical protein [Citrobacter freundii complex]|uniref:hypothetical protein n=1 Tax=Citrobacter freundii complex TaxID=1344959 RepID=UPI00295D0AAA|nr:hypothetical protein [Citrobacter freundii]